MSSIRRDGVYKGYPSNPSAGNWEKLRFLNDSEVISANEFVDLNLDNYSYSDSRIEFGKYKITDESSISIEITRKDKKGRTIMNGKIDGDVLKLFAECQDTGFADDLKFKFTEMSKQGACFIATAVYGSYNAPEVILLREYRDSVLSNNILGRIFIFFYYAFSPFFAKQLNKYPKVKIYTKTYILNKIITKIKISKNTR